MRSDKVTSSSKRPCQVSRALSYQRNPWNSKKKDWPASNSNEDKNSPWSPSQSHFFRWRTRTATCSSRTSQHQNEFWTQQWRIPSNGRCAPRESRRNSAEPRTSRIRRIRRSAPPVLNHSPTTKYEKIDGSPKPQTTALALPPPCAVQVSLLVRAVGRKQVQSPKVSKTNRTQSSDGLEHPIIS